MKYSVIIPCYNSSQYLRNTVGELINKVQKLEYEVILVNDCSPDTTYEVIKMLSRENIHIKGIDLARNSGQHNAVMAGLRYSTGDRILVCADDGQSPIELIPDMIQRLDGGADVVCALFENRGKRSFFRQLGSKIAIATSEWMLDKPAGVFFCFDFMAERFVIDEIIHYRGPYTNLEGLFFRSTHNIVNISATQHARSAGVSGYSLKKLLQLWLNGFTAFSVKPLRISAFVGVVLALVGILMSLATLVRWAFGVRLFPGWPSTTIILLVGFGFVMMTLGLIGEYIGRIYMCINDSPQYVVRELVGIKEMEENNNGK